MASSDSLKSRGFGSHRKRGRKPKDRRTPAEISPFQDRLLRDASRHAPKRRRSTFTKEQVEEAVSEYSSSIAKTSLSSVSKKHGIPVSTLHDKLKSRHLKPRGRPCLLPEEVERDLASVVVNFCEKGSVLHLEELSKIAVAYAHHQQVREFKASSTWLKNFIHRWNLEMWCENKRKVLGFHRRIAARESIIEEFIQKLFEAYAKFLSALACESGKAMEELSHPEISAAVFGMDETSLSNRTPMKYEPKKITMQSGVGSIQCLQSICQGQSTVCATLLELFCADGSSPIHWLTTKQEFSDEQKIILGKINPSTNIRFIALESGRFNASLHSTVLKEIGLLREGRPTLVIQDTPYMHKTDQSLMAADEANIFLVGIPTNSSWFLQQADDLPFLLNKSEHYQRIRDYRILHGKSPDLFDTARIYLESRRDVISPQVIIDSFTRVGQYDSSLLGPDSRQIRRKAALARERCSGSDTWDETTELTALLPVAKSRLSELQLRANLCLNDLETLQQSISQQRRSSSAYSQELHSVLQQQEELKQKMKEAEEALREAELKEAAVEVRMRSAVILEEDPEIVELFSQRSFELDDLPYLEEQAKLLRRRIGNLIKQISEAKNSPSGTILACGRGSVSLPRILQSRKSLMEDLRKFIQTSKAQQKSLTIQLRLCLGVDCNKLRTRKSAWKLCAKCNRGYCNSCSKLSSHANHQEVCGNGLEDSIQEEDCPASLSEDHIADQSFEDPSSSPYSSEEVSDAEQGGDFTSVLSISVDPPSCDNCGKSSSVIECPRGHHRCSRCRVYCNSCFRRR
jgi:hypothetical protein